MQHVQFDPEFFPTPRPIAHKMFAAITNKNARYFLEPEAGKGDLAEIIRPAGDDGDWRVRECQREVDCIEQSADLASILVKKGYPVIGYDWLTYDGVCFYDAILMNPPFSNGDEHLLKAWEFMHNGEIVCLLNQETIANPCTERRRRLAQIITEHGSVEPLADAFSRGERRTNVNVVMVHLTKVAKDDTIDLWARETAEQEPEDPGADPNYLAIRDTLGNMQHYYDKANQHMLDAFHHIRMASLYMRANDIGKATGHTKSRDIKEILEMAMSNTNSARAEFARMHRRAAWHQVFDKMDFRKWLDHKQTEEFIRDIDRNANIPFTKENIKGTLQNVFLQRNHLFEQSVANVFDELTRYFKGNTAGGGGGGEDYTGWKTNSDYMVNEKLVFPYGLRYEAQYKTLSPWHLQYGRDMDIYNDLDRIMCVLDKEPFEHCYTIGRALDLAFDHLNGSRRGSSSMVSVAALAEKQQARSQYFDIRFYKKGTVHLKFKDRELWEKFNVTASAGKKWVGRGKSQAA